jgi:Protein of unknown function (DUF1553)./Protein of unknown function (DUF1549)./Planctomycete cytochrome C.
MNQESRSHICVSQNCQIHRRLSMMATLSMGVMGLALFTSLGFADEVKPVAFWGFGQEESTPLHSHGGVHRDIPGPRPDTYPDFAPDNTAVRLDGKGARFTFADPGPDSPFDFTNGDQITLEAWVRIDQIGRGDNVYVIGKGRTGNPGFQKDNQNWALRVCERDGRICISFLFSSIPPAGTTPVGESNWHRWTSHQGFKKGPEWHHIAIAYEFGKPESLVGVIDGKEVTGYWDAGGTTTQPPTVDDDEIWIGSALGGAPACSMRGDLDNIGIYRSRLPVAVLKSRYRGPNTEFSQGPLPEEMPELGQLPQGRVSVSFHEGMPAHFRWLNDGESIPDPELKWETDAYLLDRLPHHYDNWGIRDNWKGPVLVRMASDISLPPGKHRFLMRVRGLSRLWVNGKLIARSGPMKASQDGFEPMVPVSPPPKPGMRILEHRQQEVFGEYEVKGDEPCRVVLETLAGGQAFRADPGETCVAVESVDGSTFNLLSPADNALPLTDETVTSLLAKQEADLTRLDDQRRRAAAASQNSYWKKRHDLAREWVERNPAPAVPNNASHPVDAFLDAKIQSALTASSKTTAEEAKQFYNNVLPILREHCFRCHGERVKGGLQLNSLEAARRGGDSGLPAVQPGKPHDSEMIRRIRSTSADERMPPTGDGLTEDQITILEEWIAQGARWPAFPVRPEEVAYTPIVSDEAFIRRLYLDTVGLLPTEQEVREFLQDQSPDKRTVWIDRLLHDDRWADQWMGYWLDVLAENPTLINPSLNTTGPFRWYVYESLRDNKPIDRFVTELVLLRGTSAAGGSAGFGIAAENDSPFAAKGQILSSAFLGIELQCARCHDSPYHSTKQSDLYALAAMMERKPVTVPASSRVPAAFFEKQARSSLIQVSLKPGEPVPPVWPFAEATGCQDSAELDALMWNPKDTRERLAVLITAPQNERFAEVMVNRVWRRLIGAGIVEPADDWEGKAASHPDLLKWLAREFVANNYDLRYLSRLILTSQLYQREPVRPMVAVSPERQFFNAPIRRRMSAEQVIDSLHVAVGKKMDVEELTFSPEGGRAPGVRITLGVPDRAWKFVNLANERDRPSLSLPRARAIADIMEAFGWNGARQNPRTDREVEPNLLQPGVLQNSDAAVLFSRASVGSGLADLAVNATTPDQLLESLFLQILSRFPSDAERELLVPLLAEGFTERVLPESERESISRPKPLPVVTWSNHVQPEANTIAVELEQRARKGPPADPRLRPQWRECYEDVVWGMLNTSEFIWVP